MFCLLVGCLTVALYFAACLGLGAITTYLPPSKHQRNVTPRQSAERIMKCCFKVIAESDNRKFPNHTHCTICLESFDSSQRVLEAIDCGHSFHENCIRRWIDSSNISYSTTRCPLCYCQLSP
ncbi:hypothetical protein BCR33DRAFT_712433 [Rhizoclosmatium globosum]|uniref:RING-type domain-containing protein n=1 Tax=Rhizoclosmatium globosum TaxID=329046 RepID=A0A1Y2CWE5_9FUNG|nr:hypothetical protein BCR33DRAFT_712433 [Rhizoclosmatium globosum]|eukprot:ORY51352.1 hypothetical protein BCR33DRAFT_712433 [Rhizoclosmatium globosum]